MTHQPCVYRDMNYPPVWSFQWDNRGCCGPVDYDEIVIPFPFPVAPFPLDPVYEKQLSTFSDAPLRFLQRSSFFFSFVTILILSGITESLPKDDMVSELIDVEEASEHAPLSVYWKHDSVRRLLREVQYFPVATATHLYFSGMVLFPLPPPPLLLQPCPRGK